jgi:hypothetical protein
LRTELEIRVGEWKFVFVLPISDGLTSTVRTSTAHREGRRDEVGFVYLEGKEEGQNLNDISILV